MAGKSKTASKKSKGKLARLFSNPRNVILVVFVLVFAGYGSYQLYSTSAKTVKSKSRVDSCYAIAAQEDSRLWIRYYSQSPCVLTFTRALAAVDDATGNKIGYIIVDDFVSSVVEEDIIAYQKNRGLKANGIVEPPTWRKLYEECLYIANSGNSTVRTACGL